MNLDLLFSGSDVTKSARYFIDIQYFFSKEVDVFTFRLEESDDSLLRSLGILVPEYTASHPRIS